MIKTRIASAAAVFTVGMAALGGLSWPLRHRPTPHPARPRFIKPRHAPML